MNTCDYCGEKIVGGDLCVSCEKKSLCTTCDELFDYKRQAQEWKTRAERAETEYLRFQQRYHHVVNVLMSLANEGLNNHAKKVIESKLNSINNIWNGTTENAGTEGKAPSGREKKNEKGNQKSLSRPGHGLGPV